MPEIINTFEITTLDNLDKWFLNQQKERNSVVTVSVSSGSYLR